MSKTQDYRVVEAFLADFPTLSHLSDAEIAKRCKITDKKAVKKVKRDRVMEGDVTDFNIYIHYAGIAHRNIQKAINLGDIRFHYCPTCKHQIGWKQWVFTHECTPVPQLKGGFRFWTSIPEEIIKDVALSIPGTLWEALE